MSLLASSDTPPLKTRFTITALLALPAIPDNTGQSPDSIFPADFFSSRIGTGSVSDRHFAQANAHLGYFVGDLRFDSKPSLFNRYLFEQAAMEHLIASLHVCEPQPGKPIAKPS